MRDKELDCFCFVLFYVFMFLSTHAQIVVFCSLHFPCSLQLVGLSFSFISSFLHFFVLLICRRRHQTVVTGNYNCLAPLGHLGFFCSPREYYLELGRHILLFYDTVDFFNEELITLAIRVRAVIVMVM